jgi:hypothetical protein
MEIKLPSKIENEITEYCRANQIDDINEFYLKLLKKGFDLEKWGDINYAEPVDVKTEIKEVKLIKEKDIPKVVVAAPKIKVSKVIKEIDAQNDNDIYGDE